MENPLLQYLFNPSTLATSCFEKSAIGENKKSHENLRFYLFKKSKIRK